jgi:broad specificity phosphatase PhoE
LTIALVRHGESEGNARRIFQGGLDTPLTDLGRRQAEAVGRRFAGEPVAAVYSSDLARARDTAAAIAHHHDIEVAEVPGLREYDYGDAQGLTWTEVSERWSIAPGAFGRRVIPGEEGFDSFRARVVKAWQPLADRHAGELAVCAVHGGTINQIVSHVLGLSPDTRAAIRTANCAASFIETNGSQSVILAMNEARHLDGLA